ncbi:hypothetical protein [Frankia sp. R82]|uniref:hypothetical protein n=1 Tax=Frankia sp. R82 TaxID=2950553 RepID=UPI0020443B93|nr:hypothetical protein [Frankia sp. R82]MCM3884105.1 hypothetical protein [Frankia sp. R82]
MFVYRLTKPIDLFDGLVPLRRWLTDATAGQTSWALAAVLALGDAATDVGWHGDMRHLPLVGALPTRPATTPYLLVKQDNNGDTFLVTTAPPGWLGETATQVQVPTRDIGAWEPDDKPDQSFF